MKYQRVWTRNATGLASAVALLGSWGCSLLYDLNTHQCDVTKDCTDQGPQFVNSICQEHVCVQTSGLAGGAPNSGGASSVGGGLSVGGSASGGGATLTGGSPNTSLGGAPFGGSSSAMTVGGANTTPGGSGGIFAGGGVSTAGGNASTGGASVAVGGGVSTGGAATGGASSTADCATNADCFRLHTDQASICRNGSCVLLTNTNCPVLIPASNASKLLKEQAPIIVGGFSNLSNALEPHSSVSVLNWDLAFDEFNSRLSPTYLPAYPSGSGLPRPFVGVICQGYDPGATGVARDITKSMSHMVDEIGVTSILTAMQTTDLYTAFSLTKDFNVFFMNTSSADLRLVNTQSNGMLFHMLGDPHMLSTTMVSLFHQMVPYVNAQRKANFLATGEDNPASVPLRVTLIHSDNTQMIDAHDILVSTATDHPESHLSFNGKTWTQNSTAGDAREAQTLKSGAAATDTTIINAITEIQQHPPHVIIGAATSEFASVMDAVEKQWATNAPDQIRPYYVLSNKIYHLTTLTTAQPMVMFAHDDKTPPLRLRVAGVNYASAQDPESTADRTAYETRLILANQNTSLTLTGYENQYDAAYYLLYAISAAAARRSGTPASQYIVDALTSRVVKSTGTSVDIGPEKIAETVGKFFNDTTFTMALWGTMGPPNFDTLLGTRISQTSAWCCQKDQTTAWAYSADGLIFDPVSQLFSPNKAGMPACIQNYCPQDADAGVGTCPLSY